MFPSFVVMKSMQVVPNCAKILQYQSENLVHQINVVEMEIQLSGSTFLFDLSVIHIVLIVSLQGTLPKPILIFVIRVKMLTLPSG